MIGIIVKFYILKCEITNVSKNIKWISPNELILFLNPLYIFLVVNTLLKLQCIQLPKHLIMYELTNCNNNYKFKFNSIYVKFTQITNETNKSIT